MANIILNKEWNAKESECTNRSTYMSRRQVIKSLGLGAISLGTMACVGNSGSMAGNMPIVDGPLDTIPKNAPWSLFPATKNETFTVPERVVTERLAAASYNNFYELDPSSKEIWNKAGAYNPFPWTIEVSGHVEKDFEIGLEDLFKKVQMEERLYRFRCVEAWSMTVPWTGFTLKSLIDLCKPTSKATHVKFTSVNRPEELPGQKETKWYPWPYFEGLRMDEAINELGFVAIGAYGEPLPKQSGSPLRMVLPWKYGYKGAKAINKIEFLDKEPSTFWFELAPSEYPFLSNVNPSIPHPRWSQATEKFISSGSNVTRIPSQMYNGYQKWVGDMYPEEVG